MNAVANLITIEGAQGSVLFEAEDTVEGLQEIGVMDGVIDKINGTTEKLTGSIQACLDSLTPVFAREREKSGSALEKAEISFGVSVDGTGDIYVVKVAGAANLTVKLTWDFNN